MKLIDENIDILPGGKNYDSLGLEEEHVSKSENEEGDNVCSMKCAQL